MACTTTLAPSTSGVARLSTTLARGGERHRDVGHRVAQGHEDGVEPGPAADLGDLALDPDRAEPVDVLRDRGWRSGGPARGTARRSPGPWSLTLGRDADARTTGVMTTDLGTPRVLPSDEAERAVLLAAPRGYCAGVDRAVVTVEKALDLYGAPVYVRKQIVHNKHVVADLESRGAIFVEELDEVPAGATVVFSAHGVSPEVHRAGRGARAQDHRRHLPAGDQGAPRGEAVRRRRLRHPPDRPRRPRGGRGHRGRGARAHPARREPRRRRRASWSATRPRSPGSPRRRSRSTRRSRRWPRSASGSRCCSTRPATTSATPPRTASSRSRRSPAAPTW